MSDTPSKVTPLKRKSLWASNLITLVFLGIFLLVCFGIELLVKPVFSPVGLLVTGAVMSLVPAILWLAFFYRQDRLEPEPKEMVLEVFILGGLLAAAIGIPLVNNLFNISSWLFSGFWVNLLGAILVIGFSQEFLKYAAVRFSIYESSEFDERTDGIIYATAAGLGFATVLNISFVVSSGGVNLGMGAVRIVLTALAQASFAGITGYFLGKDKLDHKPAWWVPVGISLAAVLNGVFNYLWGVLKRTGITTTGGVLGAWGGLVLAILISVTVTVILSWLIERDMEQELQLLGGLK
ncbi:MAG: PrsW family glutamic-type intramembrane protease [Anaerolineaceae bacterium]|jgi:RsiW-degrading membrane proteinase PrsW (M82 family)